MDNLRVLALRAGGGPPIYPKHRRTPRRQAVGGNLILTLDDGTTAKLPVTPLLTRHHPTQLGQDLAHECSISA